MTLFWFALPIVIGSLLGIVISRCFKTKWQRNIDLRRRQEMELRELFNSESDVF